MEKVLKIAFLELFLRKKLKKPPDPQLCFTRLMVGGYTFSLTDFPKYLKNVIFPKFLVNTLASALHKLHLFILLFNPAGVYMLKVSNRNTRARCEICSKLTIKTPERCHRRRSGVFIINFENISHLVLVLLLFTLNM